MSLRIVYEEKFQKAYGILNEFLSKRENGEKINNS